MPRTKTYARDELVTKAMTLFWTTGYYATSIDDLVKGTGVSRHGLYKEFGGKQGMFENVLEAYGEGVVSPAFAQVEAKDAGLEAIRRYFEMQIRQAEAGGLPGPGCLMANTMAESGPHEPPFARLVRWHLTRLEKGFAHALANEARARGLSTSPDVDALARFATISAQGLWSYSRMISDAGPLRDHARQLLMILEQGLAR
ncbi:MAG: TetR/AcrR family transcriptional regulator [Geminicoccaceae bacterium]